MKYWHWSYPIYALVILLAVGMMAFAVFQPITVLPRITLAPGFALTDQNGAQVTSEDMRGGITLYNFTYTDCAPPCAQTTPIMADVQSRLDSIDTGDIPVRLVTISFDPSDSPQRLNAFRQAHGIDDPQWSFLSGAPERVRWVVGGGFGIYYKERDEGGYTFDPGVMLVDWNGILRAEYISGTPDVDIILRDINLLVEEVYNSDGAARYAYEAAHLFSCYPR